MDAIVLAAGIGKRAKLQYPKQLYRLNGLPLLIHVINKLRKNSNIDKLVITVPQNSVSEMISLIEQYNIKNYMCIEGSKENRQGSVYIGLQYMQTSRCIVAESARPLFSQDLLIRLINTNSDIVVPYCPSIPTIYDAERKTYLNRDQVYNIQLPQICNTQLLLDAHKKVLKNKKIYNDESSLIFGECGVEPTFIIGDEFNIKATTILDLQVLEVYNEISCDNWRIIRDRI
jgi:2-C-methyl-D-erythritol 4-phosphate cytidylyltransferase